MNARKTTAGFTLLEVMVAVAIMAIGLSAVFSAEAGAVRAAQRARKVSLATLLVRCKMGEIEEDIAKKGLPAIEASGTDNCCKDAEIDGYKCKWEIKPIVLPDTMFRSDDDDNGKPGSGGKESPGLGGAANALGKGATGKGSGSGITSIIGAAAAAFGGKKDGADKDGKDPKSDGKDTKDKDGKSLTAPTKDNAKDLLSGDPTRFLGSGGGGDIDSITAMAMQFVYPVLKPSFQSQIRRATVTVNWSEGEAKKSFDVTQYLVAEQPVPLATDPNDPNALLSGSSTGGSTTGTGNGAGTVVGAGIKP